MAVWVTKEWDVDEFAPTDIADGSEERGIHGRVHHDTLARCSERQDGLGNGGQDIGQHNDVVSIEVPSPGGTREAGEGIGQLADPAIANI